MKSPVTFPFTTVSSTIYSHSWVVSLKCNITTLSPSFAILDTSNVVVAIELKSSDSTSIKASTTLALLTLPDSTSFSNSISFVVPTISLLVAFKLFPVESSAVTGINTLSAGVPSLNVFLSNALALIVHSIVTSFVVSPTYPLINSIVNLPVLVSVAGNVVSVSNTFVTLKYSFYSVHVIVSAAS